MPPLEGLLLPCLRIAVSSSVAKAIIFTARSLPPGANTDSGISARKSAAPRADNAYRRILGSSVMATTCDNSLRKWRYPVRNATPSALAGSLLNGKSLKSNLGRLTDKSSLCRAGHLYAEGRAPSKFVNSRVSAVQPSRRREAHRYIGFLFRETY